jgi:phage terminase large subunit GpA-like protein
MAEAADRRAAGDGEGQARLPRLEWQKLRERNEALDTRVYARAAAWILGADRWPEARWADLEAQLGVAKQDGSEAGPATAPDPSRHERVHRRRRRCARAT